MNFSIQNFDLFFSKKLHGEEKRPTKTYKIAKRPNSRNWSKKDCRKEMKECRNYQFRPEVNPTILCFPIFAIKFECFKRIKNVYYEMVKLKREKWKNYALSKKKVWYFGS